MGPPQGSGQVAVILVAVTVLLGLGWFDAVKRLATVSHIAEQRGSALLAAQRQDRVQKRRQAAILRTLDKAMGQNDEIHALLTSLVDSHAELEGILLALSADEGLEFRSTQNDVKPDVDRQDSSASRGAVLRYEISSLPRKALRNLLEAEGYVSEARSSLDNLISDRWLQEDDTNDAWIDGLSTSTE